MADIQERQDDLDLSAASGPQHHPTQATMRERCHHGDTHAIEHPSRSIGPTSGTAKGEADSDLDRSQPTRTPDGPAAIPTSACAQAPVKRSRTRPLTSSSAAHDGHRGPGIATPWRIGRVS